MTIFMALRDSLILWPDSRNRLNINFTSGSSAPVFGQLKFDLLPQPNLPQLSHRPESSDINYFPNNYCNEEFTMKNQSDLARGVSRHPAGPKKDLVNTLGSPKEYLGILVESFPISM